MNKFGSNFLVLLLLICNLTVRPQSIITQWTFNQETLEPDTGTGMAINVGGTTYTFVSGHPGKALNTSHYPAQGTNSGTAGVQFSAPTDKMCDVTISWQNRMSKTAANRLRLQYTINGSDWINFEATEQNATNTDDDISVGFDNGTFIAGDGEVWYDRSASFRTFQYVNDNPLFAVRFVTEFAAGTSYVAASPESSYSTVGTIRYDNVVITGTVITDTKETGFNETKITIAGKEIIIEPLSTGKQTFTLYSLSGKVERTYQFNGSKHIRIDLPQGIYIGRLQGERGCNVLKIYLP